jgi:MFS family permease
MSLSDTETARERVSGTAGRHRWPGMQAAGEQPRRTAPPPAAFWLVAGVFCLMFFAAGAPTPLYGVYQAQLQFSATTLTAVFAIYALVLLLTLLVFGSVSDYLGRPKSPETNEPPHLNQSSEQVPASRYGVPREDPAACLRRVLTSRNGHVRGLVLGVSSCLSRAGVGQILSGWAAEKVAGGDGVGPSRWCGRC